MFKTTRACGSAAIVGFLLCASTLPAQADSAPSEKAELVRTFVLDNGLEVSLRAIPKARTAGVVLLFRVGESHDPPGSSGLAHAVEHVFVTAAAGDIPARDYGEWNAANRHLGVNAQTASDATFVGTAFASESLDAELADFAARLIDLKPSEDDLKRERPRLRDELANMYGGIPRFAAPNVARSPIAAIHPGGRPGGLVETFDALTLDVVKDRLARFYRAGNARLAVVGGFNLDATETLIRKLFGPAPRGEAPPEPAPRPTSRPTSARVVKVPRDVVFNMGGDGRGFVSIAIDPPRLGEPKYPAYLAAAYSMMRVDYIVPGTDDKPSIMLAPIDDPGMCAVFAGVRTDETPDQAIARLKAFIARKVSGLGARDVRRASSGLPYMIDMGRARDSLVATGPYTAALSLARTPDFATLDKLKSAFADMDEATLRADAAEIFGPERGSAAVVVVE